LTKKRFFYLIPEAGKERTSETRLSGRFVPFRACALLGSVDEGSEQFLMKYLTKKRFFSLMPQAGKKRTSATRLSGRFVPFRACALLGSVDEGNEWFFSQRLKKQMKELISSGGCRDFLPFGVPCHFGREFQSPSLAGLFAGVRCPDPVRPMDLPLL